MLEAYLDRAWREGKDEETRAKKRGKDEEMRAEGGVVPTAGKKKKKVEEVPLPQAQRIKQRINLRHRIFRTTTAPGLQEGCVEGCAEEARSEEARSEETRSEEGGRQGWDAGWTGDWASVTNEAVNARFAASFRDVLVRRCIVFMLYLFLIRPS
jgi:hypothetical protein